MTRLTALASGLLLAALGTTAHAQSQAQLAAQLNEEGKQHMYAKQYAEASEKFRQAVARVPEPKYFYNLCTSRFQEGKFGEALTACNSVGENNPPPELRAKADALTQRVKDEAQAQGVALQPVGGGSGPTGDVCQTNPQDPSCVATPPNTELCQTNPQDPSCQPATQPGGVAGPPSTAVGRPPSVDLVAGTKPDNKYTWTLGVDVYGGGGQLGQANYYGTASGGLRFKSDYLLNAGKRLGAQGYVGITHLGAGENDASNVDSLDIADIGVALYKDLCIGDALCLSPLGGVHLSLMSPGVADNDFDDMQTFNYAAFGIRLEVAAKFAFGSRLEHVLNLALGTNGYTQVLSGPTNGYSAEELGLDKGGFAGYLGVGYTYRFNTPLGSSPFVTLQ